MKLYTWKTPNGYKPLILLEELGVDYELIKIPLDGTQKSEDFLKINPNGKIPALVDGEENIFESGAILYHLAIKYDKFFPQNQRNQVMEWLMFQMSGISPMFGQLNHFKNSAKEEIPYAINRYYNESIRLLEVVENQLKNNKYIASDNYSIADISLYPWILTFDNLFGLDDKFKNIKNWLDNIGKRDAVIRAYNIEF